MQFPKVQYILYIDTLAGQLGFIRVLPLLDAQVV